MKLLYLAIECRHPLATTGRMAAAMGQFAIQFGPLPRKRNHSLARPAHCRSQMRLYMKYCQTDTPPAAVACGQRDSRSLILRKQLAEEHLHNQPAAITRRRGRLWIAPSPSS